MAMRDFHDDAARHDFFIKLIELGGFLADIRFGGIGTRNIAESDLYGLFHKIDNGY